MHAPTSTRSRHWARRLAVVSVLVFWAAWHEQASGQSRRDEVLVSAASSLSDVLRDVANAFQAKGGARVVINVGSSSALAQQIRSGAPVDVFVSADEAQVLALGARVQIGTRVDLASNQLVVVVPDDRPAEWRSVSALLDPSVRRVAIADPAGVPAGVYAKAYLVRVGLWSALQSKLVPTGSVRLALAAVDAGAADAAIVYRTDALMARRSRVAWAVPQAEGPSILYVAAALREAPHDAAARRFLAFLAGADAQAILKRAGFSPPPARSRASAAQ